MNKRKNLKRILSLIFAVILVVSAMPVSSFATEAEATVSTSDGYCVQYVTVQDAFLAAAMRDDDSIVTTVTLLKDVDIGKDTLALERGQIVFDLNGKTIKGSGNYSVVGVNSTAELTIVDSNGGGRIINSGSSAVLAYGKLTVESGIISSSKFAIVCVDGDVTINGGDISSETKAILAAGDLVINGGNIHGDGRAIEIANDRSNFSGSSAKISGGNITGGIYIDNSLSKDNPIYLMDVFDPEYYLYDENGFLIQYNIHENEITSDVSVHKTQVESKVLSVEYDAGNNVFVVKVSGRASKIQLVQTDDLTNTMTVTRKMAGEIKSFNENDETVGDLSRELSYEIWTFTNAISPNEYYVRAKYGHIWEKAGTAYCFDYSTSNI